MGNSLHLQRLLFSLMEKLWSQHQPPARIILFCYLYLCLPVLHSHSLNGITTQGNFNWKLPDYKDSFTALADNLLFFSGRRKQVLRFVREVSFPSPTAPINFSSTKKIPLKLYIPWILQYFTFRMQLYECAEQVACKRNTIHKKLHSSCKKPF